MRGSSVLPRLPDAGRRGFRLSSTEFGLRCRNAKRGDARRSAKRQKRTLAAFPKADLRADRFRPKAETRDVASRLQAAGDPRPVLESLSSGGREP
jgi:hypothetical protein